jgi:hypothetical protein
MKCPKCNYVSHDYLDECRKCHVDLLAFKQQMGLLVLQAAGLDLSLVLMDESDDLFGDRMFTEADVALPGGEDDFDISLDEYSSNPLLKQQLSALRPQGNRPASDHLTLELDTSLAKDLLAEAPQGSAEPSNRIPAEPAPPALIAGMDVSRQPSSPGHLTLELDPQDFLRHATAQGQVPPPAEIPPLVESDETSYTIPTIELTDPNLQTEERSSTLLEESQTEFGRGFPELPRGEMRPELTAEALHPAGLSSSLEPSKAKGKDSRLTEELLQDDTLEEASLILEPPPVQAPLAPEEVGRETGKEMRATIEESEVVLGAPTIATRFPGSSTTPLENATGEEEASTLTEELLADDTLQEAELRRERLTPDRTPPVVEGEAQVASDEMTELQMDQILQDALEADPFEETDTDLEFRMAEITPLPSAERVLPPPEPLSSVEGSVFGVDADDGLTAQEAGSVTFDEIDVGFDIPSSAEVTPLSFENLASQSEVSRPPGSSRPREADPDAVAEEEPDFSAFDLLHSEERERGEEPGETTLDTPDYVSLDTPADLILDTPEHVTLELDAAELRAEQWIDTLSETQPEIVPEDPGTVSTFEVDLPPESKEQDPLWPSLSSHDDELLLDLDDLDDDDEKKR